MKKSRWADCRSSDERSRECLADLSCLPFSTFVFSWLMLFPVKWVGLRCVANRLFHAFLSLPFPINSGLKPQVGGWLPSLRLLHTLLERLCNLVLRIPSTSWSKLFRLLDFIVSSERISPSTVLLWSWTGSCQFCTSLPPLRLVGHLHSPTVCPCS